MWRQFKQVSIPLFNGNKKSYKIWNAAFTTCIDQTPATAEYKLLQVRSYLKGEALKVVESLGHSPTVYQAAKGRLERKYGGVRRQIAINRKELDQFCPIHPGNVRDVEKMTDLWDIISLNLTEAGKEEELGNGCLYIKVQKKITETMLADYRRWLFDKTKLETVQSLRQWLIRETEVLTIAAEIINGYGPLNNNRQRHHTSLEKINKRIRISQAKTAQNVKNNTQFGDSIN